MAERRYTVVFYGAILVALIATYGVFRVLEATKANGRIATRPVVIAVSDLQEGATIDRVQLSTSAWPVQTIPDGAYTTIDSVAGRVTRVPVFKGEPIVPGRLAPRGSGPGLEVKIAPGKRAMAVRINDIAGLSGLIQPNSRVDMLVTLREGTGKTDQVAKLFMSNLRVLSVGSQVDRQADGDPINATTATLEVTPEEAEQIAVAAKQGAIQLVLRGYGDPDTINTGGATSTDVLARLREHGWRPAAQVVEKPDPAPRPRRTSPPKPVVLPPPTTVVVQEAPRPRADSLTVRVYRGDKVSQQRFEKVDSSAASKSGTP